MKKMSLLLLLVLAISCRKSSEIKQLNKEIAGTWEFERFAGYPFNQLPLVPGNGRIIIIGTDGSFERRQHDSILFKGNYTLRKKRDCHKRSTDIIFSTNEYSYDSYQYVEIEDVKLALSTPNCYQDGGTAYYRRVR